MGYATPVHLTKDHDLSRFTCSSDALTGWLQKHARGSHQGGHTRVAVVTEHSSNEVVGYYAIAPGSIDAEQSTSRMRQGGGRHPVPVVVLARLAVHADHVKKGLGRGLLVDAIMRALAASEQIGGRALVVTCKDADAKAFYLSKVPDCAELPGNPMQLTLMLKDARKTFGAT